MSYVITAPDMLAAAAADVAGIGSSLSEANAAAAASTTRVIAAAGDEVSAAIASLFSSHGIAFQALSAQAAAFHSRFVQALNASAGAYASTEAANALATATGGYHAGASAAAASLPQSLINFRSELQLLGDLFLHPPITGSTSISTDPDLTIKEIGGLVSMSDPDDHFVGFQLQSPAFSAGVTSGADPTVGQVSINGTPLHSGQPGETVLYFQDGQIALPFTDPFA
jgi:hypothetical protein